MRKTRHEKICKPTYFDKNVDISENKKYGGYLESNEEVDKQNQASDESNEMHFDEECECGKPNKVENFKCEHCGKVFVGSLI